jgi:hypothetical protein
MMATATKDPNQRTVPTRVLGCKQVAGLCKRAVGGQQVCQRPHLPHPQGTLHPLLYCLMSSTAQSLSGSPGCLRWLLDFLGLLNKPCSGNQFRAPL